ncbi:MAG: hypothetical protein ABH843_01810 [Candidatus Omnitrophota bacterium]
MKSTKTTSRKRKRKHRLSEMLKRFFNMSLLLMILSSAIIPFVFAHDKVADGARDISKGVAAIPNTMAETANDSNIVSGLIVGTAKGVLTAVEGVCEGVYKILTFHRND